MIDSENRVISANDEATGRFLLATTVIGASIDTLAHAERVREWLDGQQTEWSPEPNMYLLPQIEHLRDETGDYRMLILRDVSQRRQAAQNQHEFIRIVSHDLRSPLTSILGFAAMLEQGVAGELNKKQQHFASKILSGIEQIVRLVENIQDAGRFDPETGFYEMSRSPCDVGEIVKRVVQHCVIPEDKAQLQINIHIENTIPIIDADATMLERAITNLVDNAIKYTPDGGSIQVETARREDHIYIRVHDNGLGLSEDDQQKLFQRHSRILRKEFKKVKGSGLGLFIVRSVAQRHNGEAWVESELGKGSVFTISLPLRAGLHE